MSRWEAQRGAPLCSNENVLPDKRSKTEKQYKNTDDYRGAGNRNGWVLFDGTLAAGASSYTVYQGGIEIEIDTKGRETPPPGTCPGMRRQADSGVSGQRAVSGLGRTTKASLALAPSWDTILT